MKPDLKEFMHLAETYSVIPVREVILADDETPLTAYRKIVGNRPGYLLESVEGPEQWGRYSFIGLDPETVFRSRGNRFEIHRNGSTRKGTGHPLEALRGIMNDYRQAPAPELPRFSGGAVGFFSYDVVRFIERLPARAKDDLHLPDACFFVGGPMVIFDRNHHTLTLLVNARKGKGSNPRRVYEQAVRTLRAMKRRLQMAHRPPALPKIPLRPPTPNMERSRFENIVESARNYLIRGDAIQVAVSRRLEYHSRLDPFTLYRALRFTNPSPYMFYLNFGDLRLIGSSPEILVRLEDRKLITRPIAGTRPRGRTPEEDKNLEQELRKDPKEMAEHIMLVDLGRNDIGRVAVEGSVKVTDLMFVERYSTVMHLVSNVVGRLQSGLDAFDVFSSCFPAGTLTGAPKVRAMEIIEELEPTRRGFYAGSVGYFGFGGNMDMCITIRSILHRRGRFYVQAGAGIVVDSVPDREYVETENKALGLKRAFDLAARGLVPEGEEIR